MSHINLRRIFAALLAFALVLGLLPANGLSISAATEEYPDVMTLRVTDGSNPIAGATVQVYTTSLGEESFDLSKTTDENGLVAFEEITRIAEGVEEVFPFYYVITAAGYETSVRTATMEPNQAAMHIDARLQAKAKVTVSVNVLGGGAYTTLDGVPIKNKTVYAGTAVEVAVVPVEGYYISAVQIGSEVAQIPAKGEAFQKTLTLTEDTQISVTMTRQFTVTQSVSEGGVLYLNGAEQETLVADENATVSFKAVAAEGYRIDSVTVGSLVFPNARNLEEYEGSVTLTADTHIDVKFVRIWTVTVTHNGNGVVEVDPSAEGGSVTVLSGTTVKITATPNEGYRVAGVLHNGQPDQTVTGANDSGYETEFAATQEYTVAITFAPNVYRILTKSGANGTVTSEASSVEYGQSVKVHIAPLDGYTVESVKRNGQNVNSLTETDSDFTFVIENITADQQIEVSFKPIAVANIKYLDIDVSAALRIDTDARVYVLKEGDAIVFSTTTDRIRVYDENNKLILGGSGNTPIRIDSSVTVARVGLYYKDANEWFAHWHYSDIEPMKIVVDKGENVKAALTPAFAPNAYGYYNQDIAFTVQAEDTGDYSGLALVEAWITCNGVKGAVQTLYRYDGGEILPIYTAEQAVTVEATANSGNNVTLSLRVVDRAGNEYTTQKALKIGVETPAVALNISGTQSVGALSGYYNSSRTLVIIVNDRADTFHAEGIAQGMKIYRNGTAVTVDPSAIAWTHDGDLHTGTYTFTEDGHYTWSLSYTNKASNSATEVTAPTDCNIYDFTLDTANPYDLSITYEPGFLDTLLEGISFGFYKAPVKVILSAKDATAGIDSFTYSYTAENGEGGMEKVVVSSESLSRNGTQASAEFTIPPQFRGKVSFTATDRAGRSTTLTDEARVLVVDSVAPGITVEYDDTAAQNGSYYASARTATIRVEEANFFAQDLEDGYLVLKVTKTLADGTVRQENWKPNFTKDGTSYVAQISFAEDADYVFDVSYTDRAGNVFDSYPEDRFTVDLTKPEISVSFDNNTAINENHFMAARTATITVIEHNFRASDFVCSVTENGAASEYYAAFLKNDENWTHDGDVHTASLVFTGGLYRFDLSCTDLAGHKSEEPDFANSVAPQNFVVDTGAPQNLKISYAPTFVDTVLEAVTFGFYKAPVEVTVEATDATAGVDYFTYSYTVQNGASETNTGKTDVVIPSENITYDGDRAYASFTVPAEFRGYVSFTATDRSGHSAFFADSKVVVVDTVAPGITVSYDNLNAANGEYFNADRTATVTIEEANFFAQDLEDGLLKITVSKTDAEGNTTTEFVKPDFTKNGDVYTAQISFTENADYSFDISYTDRAGNVFDSYEEDIFTIDKIAPKLSLSYDEGYYFTENVTLRFTVEEHNFRAEDMSFDISATDVTGEKAVDLSEKGFDAYLRNASSWTQEGDVWTAEITLDAEGNYQISTNYTDLAAISQGEAIEAALCIDKSTPYDLSIRYEPGFVGTLLEALTFGFYQAPVTVTLEAKDDFAGIDHFVYSYAGATVRVATEDMVFDANGASYAFTVPAQFRGNISFVAIDKAELEKSLTDEKILVVDTVAPGITVSYDNQTANGSYFNAPRTATIRIKEANFFQQDIEDGLLNITVGKTLSDGTHTVTNPKPTFAKDGEDYVADILFAEDADYSFDITYTDRSGNTFDAYEEDRFTVDTVQPVIQVSYDNNAARNGDQFSANRSATIRIAEHNFDPSQVRVTVTANGTAVEGYTQALQKAEAWSKDGDVYTAVVSFADEAHYTFDITCTDMAGLWNDAVDYGTSVAPTAFTVDKSAPTDLDIRIAEKSVLGSNSIAFDTFYNEKISIRLSAAFDISGMESMEYQAVPSVSLYAPNGTWKPYNEDTGIVIEPSEKLIVYFRATDRAGNATIVNSTGIVVDDQMPTGEVNAPAIDILPSAANANGIHNGSVRVALKVLDPKYLGANADANGFYSGLKTVSYRIYTTDTEQTQSGVLMSAEQLTGAVTDADGLISSWSGAIEIDAQRFNSNFVMVEITAEDNAGNVRTTTTRAGDIKIDITAPRIDVSYSNNTAENGTYFKAERVATVTVTERNFEPSQVRISLTNRNGAVPQISSWTRTEGGGNGDNDRWVATIRYSNDGDYTFDIAYTDLAGNAAGEASYGASVAPKAFTIDRTQPTIEVSYDNNEVFNGSYYQKARTATIVITEKNLDPNGADKSRVKLDITAVQGGEPITAPTVFSWMTSGSQHTATITYAEDAYYSFDISVTDKAGNSSADFERQSFCVDQTAPELRIENVEDGKAYAGDIAPLVTYSDVNLNGNHVELSITTASGRSISLPNSEGNGTVAFENIPNEKEYDDVYTLSAKITDAAGNVTEQTVKFSVNRFGSTYEMDAALQELIGSYVQTAEDIVLTETNVTPLSNIQITLFKNNETIVLEEGKDFSVEETVENGVYRYTYTIFAENFADDGVYKISVRSEDEAGNVSENFLDTKDAALSFGVDKTAPTVVMQNLESDSTYGVEILDVLFSANDNLLLDSVTVYLDDMSTPVRTWNAEEIAQLLAEGADFTFPISGDSTQAHTVKLVCKDAAGNETELEVSDFYVTTNLWVRYWNNKGLFFGSIGGVLAIAAGLIALLTKKKKAK